MLKTLIIDDEIDAINSIELILNEYCPNVTVVGRAGSITEARREIVNKHPDFIILDIEMPRGSGFDLLEFMPDRDFEVIFVTAFNNYAIQAFKYSAVDYILKPVDIDELIKAVNRVEKIRKAGAVQSPSYETLLENLKASQPSKLVIHTSSGMQYIHIRNIIRFEAEGSYTKIFLRDGNKLMASKNLKDFQDLLNERDFFRPHHSHLINLEHVVKYVFRGGGHIEMTDGCLVPISRRKKEIFILRMDKFVG